MIQFLLCQTNIRLSFYIFCDRFFRFNFLVSVGQANLTCKQAKRSELYIHYKQRSSITFYLLVMVILSLIMMMNYQMVMMMIPVDPRLLWFCPQLRSIPRRPLSSSFSDRPQFSKWDPVMEIGMEMMIVNELVMIIVIITTIIVVLMVPIKMTIIIYFTTSLRRRLPAYGRQ